MPRDNSIKKVLVIGSGAIVIGQGAEFDYSGTQACRALREEGVEVVLINSNPATIMTDKEIADKIYIEPLTIEFVEKVIAKERPDSLIAGMGGQKGLNLAVELYDKGILEKYNVRVIGTSIEAIKRGEDRETFKEVMTQINQPSIASEIVTNMEEGITFAEKIGYPVIIRPAYTLGGTGGGIAEDIEELKQILQQGLQKSPVGQVLLEKSIKGWKEIEYEVIRDADGSGIAVCNMENIDPVGVHTGDSIVVAPTQTLSLKECKMLRKASLDIIEAVGIEGGCNVQFALNPESFEYAVIEINPRVSRSSALASKATGYPIAKVATKIALGYRLEEIKNDVTGSTFACFEPTIDYVVVKIPKWPFDKFQAANRRLGTKMMATGEVMAIGRNIETALLKGVRSMELEQYTLQKKSSMQKSLEALKKSIITPDDERIFDLAEMVRRGYRLEKVEEITGIDMFFLEKLKVIIEQEEELKTKTIATLTKETLSTIKKIGFSDKGISQLLNCSPMEVYSLRKKHNIYPTYKMVDTCSGEFEAISPYYYSSYEEEDEVVVSSKKKVMVIGSGPIRIGQGIEFDYCSVHSVLALKKQGIETIIVNNNPETVSTDFNIADKLYFEPLTEEDVLNIIEKERPYGVILQFGGQTAIKLSRFLREMGIPVLGTSPEEIDRAEDREKFEALMEDLNIKRPQGKGVNTVEKGIIVAEELGYPVLVRPSYVLGGQGMEITYNPQELRKYLQAAFEKAPKNTVLIDRYLIGKEIEVDAIGDGEDVLIPGIMEHLERAGVHSGDSISVYPPQNLSEEIKQKVLVATEKIAKALHVKGMINIQFIEQDGEIYIIEVNPRSSRTVPYISKVTDLPVIELATKVMLGAKLKELAYGVGLYPEAQKVAVKVPVFSTEKLPLVEISLGPEMKSTGEVLGVGRTFSEALYKGIKASEVKLPKKGESVLVTIRDRDKEDFYPLAERMVNLGYELIATSGTAAFLQDQGIKVTSINKVGEEKPTVLDAIKNKAIQLVINIPTRGNDVKRDGFQIRREAIEAGINVVTSLDTATAMMEVLEAEMPIDTLEIINLGGKR